ncbi:MAG: 5-(carboxyamino)imidazole ribonucleotide synthase [Bacteroidetes bacterium]|nr:5-(carboxyamino)imidazole ribonucleotide synthase [Bacteroidota bacterium]
MKNANYGKNFKLGMLGGGQLGQMFIQQAMNFDVRVHCLDPDPDAPCADLASSFTVGSLTDFDTVYSFGKSKDLLTIEIENVNIDALDLLQKEGKIIFPSPRTLRIIQDKGLQKEFYAANNLPTAGFSIFNSKAEIQQTKNFPFVQKLRTGGYDGKGVQVIRNQNDFEKLFDAPSIVEEMIPFIKELSVIVSRNQNGQTAVYPTVECEFNPDANLVEFLFSPADISENIEKKAQEIALDVINKLDFVGILAVELFLTESGEILINEVAPRPHNSGHQTIEGNITSQFEQHLRSILNWPLGSTDIIQPSVMINLLGSANFQGKAYYENLEDILQLSGVHIHLYGKEFTKPFRKMGHVTICHKEIEEAKKIARQVKEKLKVISL